MERREVHSKEGHLLREEGAGRGLGLGGNRESCNSHVVNQVSSQP